MLQVDRLYEAVAEKSPVCVGLDTDFSYIPAECVDKTLSKGENIFRFNRDIIEATRSVAGCFKVQIAYYEALGLDGMLAYKSTLEYLAPGGPCGHRGHQARRHCQNGRDVCQGPSGRRVRGGLRYAGALYGAGFHHAVHEIHDGKGQGRVRAVPHLQPRRERL